MEAKAEKHDLTAGGVTKRLLLFVLPIFLGSLLQQLYSTVDAIIVGQFAGKEALAAIDAVFNLTRLPVSFFVGLGTGATILGSQQFGAKKFAELSATVHTAMAFAALGGVVLSLAGVAAVPLALGALAVPGELYGYTSAYAYIYFGGLLVSMVYNIGAGILRAMGDSKTPFYILAVACGANVALDLWFVAVLGWHTAGAALATVLAQLLSAALVVRALVKTYLPCKLNLRAVKIQKAQLARIVRLGLPVGVQSALYPLANMVIQANVNSFGTDSIAAWAVCGKLDLPLWLVVDSVGAAVSTFVAQNIGAGLPRRARKGIRTGMAAALLWVAALSAVLFFFTGTLGRLFVRDDTVLSLAAGLMRLVAPAYCLFVVGDVLAAAIRGAGETTRPMLLTLVGTCATRLVWIWLVAPLRPTLLMVVACYPVSWGITALAFVVYYSLFKKRLRAGPAPQPGSR